MKNFEFFKDLESIESVNKKIETAVCSIKLKTQSVDILSCVGMTTSCDIVSSIDLPAFSRSIYDGYAVFANDISSASQRAPIFLSIQKNQEIVMGQSSNSVLLKNSAIYVPTGGIIPAGANAIIMIEHAKVVEENTIMVCASVCENFGIMKKGEDIPKNSLVLAKGSTVRPQDIGALCAIGLEQINVFAKPKFCVFATGDEIIHHSQTPRTGQIRDINTFAISSLIVQSGGEVVLTKILGDNFDTIQREVEKAKSICDIIIISGGSSVGKKDYTAQIIAKFATILTHGMAIKPGKPTIVAQSADNLFFGLPGHPASAFMVFKAIISPMLDKLFQRCSYATLPIKAVLSSDISFEKSKTTFQAAFAQINESGEIVATPVVGKSGSIMLLCKANGYCIISGDSGVLRSGSCVDFYYF